MVCCRTRTRVAVVVRGVFEGHGVVGEFYIFRRIRVVCRHDEGLVGCHLPVVALVAIAITFAIFTSIVASTSLCIVLSVSRLLILIVRVLALTIRGRIYRRCNCEPCERLRCLKLCRRLLHWLAKMLVKTLQVLHRLFGVSVVCELLSRGIRVVELLVEEHARGIDWARHIWCRLSNSSFFWSPI